jgi:protein gp37
MGDRSQIEWTDATWNPIRGCSRVSEGCRNCYAERQAVRQSGAEECDRCDGVGWFEGGRALKTSCDRCEGTGIVNAEPYFGLVESTPRGPRWTGKVAFAEDLLDLPIRWRRPRWIFVNSMSDLFHEKVSDEWLTRIFEVMAKATQHHFQVLTKRPERMRSYLGDWRRYRDPWPLPLPNVWLG